MSLAAVTSALSRMRETAAAVAGATERLGTAPTVALTVAVKPAAGSLSKALAEDLDSQQGEPFIRKLRERLG